MAPNDAALDLTGGHRRAEGTSYRFETFDELMASRW